MVIDVVTVARAMVVGHVIADDRAAHATADHEKPTESGDNRRTADRAGRPRLSPNTRLFQGRTCAAVAQPSKPAGRTPP